MYRLLAFPAVLLAFAAGPGTAIAQAARQTPASPDCNIQGAEATLKAGGTPDFRGCFIGEAARLLMRLDYQIRQVTDEAVSGVERGRITSQSRDGRLFVLRVSTGRGFPPQPTPTRTTTPAPPTQPETPSPSPVEFSITGTSRTVEGGDLVFRILRRGNDGNRHRIALTYSPAELLENPPPNLIIGPSEPVTQLRLRTIAGSDEEGTRLVNVRLTDVSGSALIGSRNLARGVIEDAPAAPANYSVRPDGIVNRGEAIRFVVSRTGPLAESDIEYGIGQGSMPIGAEGARRVLHFAAGSEARPITVLPTSYDPCGEPVNVTLLGVAGEAPAAVAAFSNFVPEECREATPPPTAQPVPTDVVTPGPSPTFEPQPGPEPNWFLIDLALKWWPAVAVILLSVLGFIFRAVKRAADRKKQLVETLTGIELDPKPVPQTDTSSAPAQPVSATCRIESGISELLGDEDKMQVWPGFRARVTLERGMASVPDPLPIAEEPNG